MAYGNLLIVSGLWEVTFGGAQWWNDAAVMVVEKLLMGSARPRSLEKLVKDGENGQMPVRLLLIARFEVSFSWTWINGSTECREALWRHAVDWPQIGMVRFPHKGVRDQVYRYTRPPKALKSVSGILSIWSPHAPRRNATTGSYFCGRDPPKRAWTVACVRFPEKSSKLFPQPRVTQTTPT